MFLTQLLALKERICREDKMTKEVNLKRRSWTIIILSALLLLIDQVVKILIKTNMTIGQSFDVFGDWFKILFVENEGMAFGMAFGGEVGKLLLTSFRIILVIALIYYIVKLLKRSDVKMGVIVGFSLIMVGALGNIIDSFFYGVLFSESTYTSVAQFLPEGGGYAPLFHGKVVDMLYFPLIDTTFPEWIPFIGGKAFRFFQPIFNIADSCITCGAFYLLLFQSKFFMQDKKEKEVE